MITPCLYTLLPPLPSLSSTYDPHSASTHDHRQFQQFYQTIERGNATIALEKIVKEERDTIRHRERSGEGMKRMRERDKIKKRKLELGKGEGDHPEDQNDVSESGQVEKRKPGRPRKTSTTSMAIQRDENERAKKHRRIKLPKVETPDVVLPDYMPQGDLLSSLHYHTSLLLTSHHHLLPPLTTLSPILPSHLISHFTEVEKRLNREEEKLLLRLPHKENHIGNDNIENEEGCGRRREKVVNTKQIQEIKKTRMRQRGRGQRNKAWIDAERGFDSSALIALGMLSELLVENTFVEPPPQQQAPISPASSSATSPNQHNPTDNRDIIDRAVDTSFPPSSSIHENGLWGRRRRSEDSDGNDGPNELRGSGHEEEARGGTARGEDEDENEEDEYEDFEDSDETIALSHDEEEEEEKEEDDDDEEESD